MSNKIVWNEEETNEGRLRRAYKWLEWLMYEMQDGTVPNMNVPLSIAFVKMAEKGEIDEITASEHTDMFLPWQENHSYNIGDLRAYTVETETKLYKCLQAHTSQADWTPDTATSLWKVCGISENGIPYWSQPISTIDAYMLNDEVISPDDGLVWVSDYDNNVWEPGVFGWHIKEVAE